jgi:hypothetical protein
MPIIPTPNGLRFRVSSMIRDPFVRAAFERSERDDGRYCCTKNVRPRTLEGGNAEHVPDPSEETRADCDRTRLAIAYA